MGSNELPDGSVVGNLDLARGRALFLTAVPEESDFSRLRYAQETQLHRQNND